MNRQVGCKFFMRFELRSTKVSDPELQSYHTGIRSLDALRGMLFGSTEKIEQ